MTQLAVSDTVISMLKHVAEARGTTTQNLAEQAIRDFLEHDTERQLQQEADAYRAMHGSLLPAYGGQYVAIYRGQMIDHDADQLALYLRIDQRFPNDPVLIRQVLPDPEEVYTFRSPTIETES